MSSKFSKLRTSSKPKTAKQDTPRPKLAADSLDRRTLLAALRAYQRGDFDVRLPDSLDGVDGEICTVFNDIAQATGQLGDQTNALAIAVVEDGLTKRRLRNDNLRGSWGAFVDANNTMLDGLTSHQSEIFRVVAAVAQGNLRERMDEQGSQHPVRGQFLHDARAVNAMVEQLSALNSELTRTAMEVGVEGHLGAQAKVRGVSGAWKELADAVNLMASSLTGQVREIARVTTAVAQGDLTKTINIEVRGEILALKNTINTMVDQLGSFADEVTRVAREVGSEGILGGQAQVRGVSGVWRELTENVNGMANNLTGQVRNIAEVATAIAEGDLSKKITVDARGEILELKNTINTMVDQLGSFADEVTRVAREVGTEGVLGGEAEVSGMSGMWRELTENVNGMANNLTDQVRNIAEVTTAIAEGDLSRKITVDARGEILALKNTINTTVDKLNSFSAEVTRVARLVGTEGTLGVQAEVRDVSGIWKELTDNVNQMGRNLTDQVRDIAAVTTAVANGDLSKKITVQVKGEILALKNTINAMVDQLGSFADEVTRMAREVGTEGVLGGQAEVRGVSGIWKELTDNVNVMARNLTEQVRGIARVVTAVANGNLQQRLQLEAKGEIATLVDTINDMTGTLSTFADQVTSVARAVGVQGILGGQADVPGAAGIWRDLTNNVNELAGNLTRQVRAIGDVATAVTKGDLTQSITVEARGEVATLKDNLNQMIRTLAETTRVNQEQDWLKTNLTRFTRMLQGQRDLLSVARQVLSELAATVGAQHGVFYMARQSDDAVSLELYASYAYKERKTVGRRFMLGEGLVGQAALERQRILVTEVPHDYIQINSALGQATPTNLAVVPIVFEDDVKGVIELASFQEFSAIQLAFLEQLLESLGIVVATIEAQMRTDELLRQSQSLAEELQTQQEELQQSNEALEHKARQLTAQKTEVERKNHDVELARQELEEKAEQLALTSKYKSEFLANMSHELRTPLNSLLILSKQLADNREGNLEQKQVVYAETIHSAGADLLDLINEILDLAKIESGTIAIETSEVELAELEAYVDRTFAQVAQEKGLSFAIELDDSLAAVIVTDEMRLKQVLRNLLSNAFKFTDRGGVSLTVEPASDGGIAFTVTDTGIGIRPDQQRLIFEAFQQADGGANRKYGGTGLGLSISREIVALLGGSLEVESEVGAGSVFVLRLPCEYRRPTPEPASSQSGSSGKPSSKVSLKRLSAPAGQPAPRPSIARPSIARPSIVDDRSSIAVGDRVLLIIDGDASFARTLLELGRGEGFRAVVASSGDEGLDLALELEPDAITLDLNLPDMNGWALLDRLKHSPRTRHIPISIITAAPAERRSLEHGALAFLDKPATTDQARAALARLSSFIDRGAAKLLIVEDDETRRESLIELVGDDDIDSIAVATAEQALEAMDAHSFDCVVLALELPGSSALELTKQIRRRPEGRRLPIVIYTSEELSKPRETELRQLTNAVIVKDLRSPERLLDATALFLHRSQGRLPSSQGEILRRLAHRDPALAGRKVMVVDDDVRNIFAIITILEQHDMEVIYAEDGADALAKIRQEHGVEVVLMDIMMPEMDGYEATRRIRNLPGMSGLPIIALTAKAMKGDREKCIQAGASDYITKPINADQLISLLRVWLYR